MSAWQRAQMAIVVEILLLVLDSVLLVFVALLLKWTQDCEDEIRRLSKTVDGLKKSEKAKKER